MRRTYADNAKLYHDLHNHIEAIYQCLIQGDTKEAVRYCEDLRTPVREISQTVWTGDKVSSWLFDFARPQVNLIYGMKEGESLWLLSLLMLVLIGPAEEIFWRGYVQRTLSARWSPDAGFVVTTLVYALVHAASCNFMLVMAAAVAGVVWGGLYRLFPRRLGAIIVSHAVWDVAVFVWFPI